MNLSIGRFEESVVSSACLGYYTTAGYHVDAFRGTLPVGPVRVECLNRIALLDRLGCAFPVVLPGSKGMNSPPMGHNRDSTPTYEISNNS